MEDVLPGCLLRVITEDQEHEGQTGNHSAAPKHLGPITRPETLLLIRHDKRPHKILGGFLGSQQRPVGVPRDFALQHASRRWVKFERRAQLRAAARLVGKKVSLYIAGG